MPRSRPRSRSQSPARALPGGADPISESDYYNKSPEFSVWLKDEKHKYFDDLSGERARKYFRKFVKEWNRGKLHKSLYAGIAPSTQSATSQTSYKWGFASKASKKEKDAIENARAEITALTYGAEQRARSRSSAAGPSASSSGARRAVGPTLPSREDIILAREAQEEADAAEREYRRKRERKDAKDRVEDIVGPREVGRERMMEKKREKREGDRSFRERGDEGFVEADESTLMGGGDSFKEQIARRDAARKRFEEKRGASREDKTSVVRERAEALREKEKATMDMFMQMAKQKFG